MITVFTPAYNRAHLLPRLYESLCKQSYKDFEWVIVDDGSTDGTAELFHLNENVNDNENPSIFPSLNSFKVRYYYQENGGKHRAINRGVKEAKGELFFIADSDDMLPPDALEIVAKQYEGIKDDKSFAGVAGYDVHSDGKIIGHGSQFDILECSPVDFWCKYKMKGDMKEVFRTNVLREIPFPEIEGENFCPEELVWVRISKKYKLRYFNKVIYIADYLSDGLSAKLRELRMNNPVSAVIDYSEFNSYGNIPFFRNLRNAINYWRFRFCIQKKFKNIPRLRWFWNWTMPIGWIMHINDLRKVKSVR